MRYRSFRDSLVVMGVMLGAALVQLQGPHRQIIYLAPGQVTNLRTPRDQGHFAQGTRCLIFMTDSRYVATTESCEDVRRKLGQ